MKTYHADLHVHTALSPCAEDSMTPPNMVLAALQQGLDIVAVCDHNSAGNVRAVRECALEMAGDLGEELILIVPGIEINTLEEVHVLGLFAEVAAAEEVGALVAETLPAMPPLYGRQWLVNAAGERVGEAPGALSLACGYDLDQVIRMIHERDGLAIAAHVDRPSFSVVSQLGFLPKYTPFDAVEISVAGHTAGREREFGGEGFPLVTASDAHSLEEIGLGQTLFQLRAPSFEEMARALRWDDGRSCGLG